LTLVSCWGRATFTAALGYFDFKGDELIEQLGATELSVNISSLPKKPGLYVSGLSLDGMTKPLKNYSGKYGSASDAEYTLTKDT
jgi:hypothetical protein